MNILSDLRSRLSSHNSPARSQTAGEGKSGAVADPPLPFAGYDRLDDRKAIDSLADHSQVELEAVEAYERFHKSRVPVLDKLRYMRGSEPFPGYDALSTKEVVTALEQADRTTAKKVRGYERKFANRPSVLEAVVRARRRAERSAP